MDPTEQTASAVDRQPQLLHQAQSAGSGIRYRVGLDVGSTTVKAVVIDAETDGIVWHDYQRHDTRQPEKLLEFLRCMEAEIGIAPGNCRMFITGSGGHPLSASDRRASSCKR